MFCSHINLFKRVISDILKGNLYCKLDRALSVMLLAKMNFEDILGLQPQSKMM